MTDPIKQFQFDVFVSPLSVMRVVVEAISLAKARQEIWRRYPDAYRIVSVD